MKQLHFLLILLLLILPIKAENPSTWDADTPLSTVRTFFGEPLPAHALDSAKRNKQNIAIGRDIFEQGYAIKPDGEKGEIQSKFFTCNDCHNIAKEDPDLRVSDPEKRFDYVQKKNLPFLQGTTMKGTVNKSSWYNGDYSKRYGDKVKPASTSLKEAIQLCARECSQGRELETWELDGMLAYFWANEYTLGDLLLSEEDLKRLKSEAADSSNHKDLLLWLKSWYLSGSPATFGLVPEDHVKGYGMKGDYERGEQIYMVSCLHCHAPKRILKWPYVFKYDKHTFGFLTKYFGRNHHFSVYNALRIGTYTGKKKKLYMPNFTLERMSDQQIEDLREYITNFLDKKKNAEKK